MNKKTFFIIAGILAGVIILRLAYMYFKAPAKSPSPPGTGTTTPATGTTPGTQTQTTVGAGSGTSIADMLFNESFSDFINHMKNTKLV